MADMELKIEQARKRLKDLQTHAQKLKRRDETRRKIIYGAAVLAYFEELEETHRSSSMEKVTAYISRETDRKFLGLPLKEGSGANDPATTEEQG